MTRCHSPWLCARCMWSGRLRALANFASSVKSGLDTVSAACGAMAVLIKQREKPVVVFLVFVPVLFVLLLAGALLFHIYVLRNPIEL